MVAMTGRALTNWEGRMSFVGFGKGHFFADGALKPKQADAEGGDVDQFADRADPAVGEVVDIVDAALAVLERDDQVFEGRCLLW
jgi:hypothetical protein